MNRRSMLIAAGGAAAIAGAGGAALWSVGGQDSWHQAIADARSPIDESATGPQALRELVRYATLAANSHNTQAWQFEIAPGSITLLPDFARRTPQVDPDDHHLFASLGAAAENIVQAAPMVGLSAQSRFVPQGDGRIVITLSQGAVYSSALARAIPMRQCTRSLYDGSPLPPADLDALSVVGEAGIEIIMLTDAAAISAITDLIVQANTAQMADSDYIAELKQWLRFSYAEAVSHADGLFSAVSGNPVLPGALGRLLFDFVVTTEAENNKYREQIASSAGLAIFVSAQNDKSHWISVGRAYQRFALQASVLGIKHAFVNQAVEVPAVRTLLAAHLDLGQRRPDLIVRFGYAQAMPFSMRRPIAEVIR